MTSTDGLQGGVILSSIGPLQGVIIDFGGSQHRVGDRLSYLSASGTAANGAVLTVDDSSIVPTIVSGGSGFTTNAVITLIGGSGTGASFIIDSISNTESINTYVDTVSDLSETRIDANTFISSNTGSISANLAIANVSSVIGASLGVSSLTVGTIASMSATARGAGYTDALPVVDIREDSIADLYISDGAGGIKGYNANVIATPAGGSIVDVSVDNNGLGYNRIDPITVTNLTRSAQNATGAAQVTGIVSYNGKYTDTKGFLSWNNRLQDNYYYQQFSYSLRTKQSIDTYREIVKSILHPAGTNVFADLRIESNAAITFTATSDFEYLIEFAVLDSIASTVAFGETSVGYGFGPTESILSTASVSNDHALSFIFDAGTVVSTAVLSTDHVLSMIINASAIASTAQFSTDYSIDTNIGGLNLNTIASTLQFGTSTLVEFLDPTTIVSTAVLSTDYDIDMSIGGLDLNTIASTLQFGTSTFVEFLDPDSTASTASVPNPEMLYGIVPVSIDTTAVLPNNSELIYGISLESIASTATIPTNHNVLRAGQGTMTNFVVNVISDLAASLISEYNTMKINTLPGNRIFNGVSTSFTSQLVEGSVILLTDINDTLQDFTLTVDVIDDANTLSVTSNVLYSNGDIAVIAGGTFLFAT